MTGAASRRRPVSRRRYYLFRVAALALGLIATEGLAWIGLRYVEQAFRNTTAEVQEHLRRTGEDAGNAVETIHPYLGWVMNPDVARPTSYLQHEIPVNRLGFNDFEQGIPQRSPDKLVVAICGGSVAWQLSVAGEETLKSHLAQDPAFQGRELQIVRLAMSGYKQPQQLMALNYLLALGADFDLVVNIDGYNEVALTVAENIDSGVFAAYPRMWNARMLDVVDPREYDLSFRLLATRAQRQRLATARRNSWLADSPTLNLIWYLRDLRLQGQLTELAGELRQRKMQPDQRFPALGPAQLETDREKLRQHVVDLWLRSSLQMHHVCEGRGIPYLHILQPNQYDTGSKPLMSEEERVKTVFERQDYGAAVAEYYPLLRQRSQELQAEGVAFHDLTQMFRTIREPVYADPFCHYNALGNRLVATELAEFISQTWNTHPDTGNTRPVTDHTLEPSNSGTVKQASDRSNSR